MGLKDVYYKYTDGLYSKRSKEAVKELETFIKKHQDFFITQDKIAETISIGIKNISQISNIDSDCSIDYETSEVNRVLNGTYDLLVNNAKKNITKNNIIAGSAAVSLVASTVFLPLAIKSIPASFWASRRIKKSGMDIYEECIMALEENNNRIDTINSKYGGVKEWRKSAMRYIDEAEKNSKEIDNYSGDYNSWSNEQKRTFLAYISAINNIGKVEYNIL